MTITAPTKTVAVLGSAYGGIGAAASLARRLPSDWRVVLIDRNTHANHVYPFPRFTVLPEHAPKAFLPLSRVFANARLTEVQGNVPESERTGSPLPPAPELPASHAHQQIQGVITALSPNSVTYVLAKDGAYDDIDLQNPPAERVETLAFDYCVYALGGALSAPSDAWAEYPGGGRGTKAGGVAFLARQGKVVEQAQSIIVVGGGALGIQFATDIKDVHPSKEVTLLHSRPRLMPIYSEGLHDEVVRRCGELGVNLVLGERVMSWPTNPGVLDGTPKTVTTDKGTSLSADLVLVCTGTKPHSGFMRALDADAVAPNGCIRVKDTLQVASDDGRWDTFFAIGDCADTTAIRAGHMSFAMGSVAARNIVRLIAAKGKEATAELEKYVPEEAKIKVTLGLRHNCVATPSIATPGDNGVPDIGAKGMWVLAGAQGMPDDA
ncbi:FAD/NAD(P)-binding domain-containing protein [Cutaneotrichosporon oleaginosum]|uniref:FAD/NAD(P)-binding domain-containing protein n=1 Tax=Cutaneotrichosporon oleaginosum TaxID=879819 RepID=A0A0J1BCH5_9TREE|nr:FAD/NAD(P)-binding domain-containing protein [Cutaneotrichosporon oleaginosum]KLT45724.1 FAD/NAD(P)-binding domain-containing protein [Cutaneotrichosporon oleaginosum]TXT04507.1 hypothetical protein COLE_07326 [Cutaneotrichosporon oleaginosum]